MRVLTASAVLALLASGAAAAPNCREGIQAAPGTFCQTVADCRAFCSCSCTFDEHGWTTKESDDTSTDCPNLPGSGPGIIAADSADLHPLPNDYRYIVHDDGARATDDVLAALRRLDARLAASPQRASWDYKIRVQNCWRSHVADTVRECGYVLKAKFMLAKKDPPKGRDYWEEKSDPRNLGLVWPGFTPHSAGIACDLVLLDRRGNPSFDSRAGVEGAPTSSIPAHDAVQLIDAELTNDDVGARRLTYEAWHFEWGASEFSSGSLCKGDVCDRYWPVTGVPPKN